MKGDEGRREFEGEEGRKCDKTTKNYLAAQTNNVGVSVMPETLPQPPSQKIMTWTHPSVKQNKSTASSACSFHYLFLASRRVYKTAPYCIS